MKTCRIIATTPQLCEILVEDHEGRELDLCRLLGDIRRTDIRLDSGDGLKATITVDLACVFLKLSEVEIEKLIGVAIEQGENES